MIAAIADSHAALWYLWNDSRLSSAARTSFESAAETGDQIGVSALTFIELIYLIEKGRIPKESFDAITGLFDQEDSLLREIPVDQDIAQAMFDAPRAQIPDMPDRVIAATAMHYGVPLITRDHRIRSSVVATIW